MVLVTYLLRLLGHLLVLVFRNISDDTSPQLGGNLDVVTHSIVSTSNRDINITPHGTGKVVVDEQMVLNLVMERYKHLFV